MKNILILGSFAMVASAHSAQYTLKAILSAANEVPAANSPAKGTFFATYDSDTNVLVVTSMSVTGFVGTLTVSHIHRAPVGSNGPVSMDFGSAANWTGAGIGNYNYNPPSFSFNFNQTHEALLLNGGSYVNVHSSAFPGGEARGQIEATVVPEPASMAIVGLGLAFFAKRRRQK